MGQMDPGAPRHIEETDDMARIRTVKPELFSDEKLAGVSIQARYLFVGLFTESDDEGLLYASSKRLAGALFPHDETVSPGTVGRWLGELEAIGRVVRYSSQGIEYLCLPTFWKHQKISHPTPSKLPRPSDLFPEWPPKTSGSDSGAAPELFGPSRTPAEQGTGNREQGKEQGTGIDLKTRVTAREVAEGFTRFWEIYPAKVAKGGARAKFDKLVRGQVKGVTVTIPEILAGATRYRDDPNRGYTKHPTTWLNQGCWDDGPLPEQSSNGKPSRAQQIADLARQRASEGR